MNIHDVKGVVLDKLNFFIELRDIPIEGECKCFYDWHSIWVIILLQVCGGINDSLIARSLSTYVHNFVLLSTFNNFKKMNTVVASSSLILCAFKFGI